LLLKQRSNNAALKFKTQSKMKTFLVNFYNDSYQYCKSTMHEVSEVLFSEEMPQLKRDVKRKLEADKAVSNVGGAFWATFSEFDGRRWNENFDIKRVLV